MARIISVVSGKGGVGKTTVVANLGVVLATKFKKDVIIVDCNITTSHLGLYIGMYYTPVTLNDVLKGNVHIKEAVYEHMSGLKIIPASLSMKDLRGVDMIHLGKHIDELHKYLGKLDIIILDVGPGIGRESITAIKASDEVLFVTTPYIPAVSDIIKCRQIAEENKINMLGIVLNMVFKEKHELLPHEIEELTELPVVASIPFDKNVLKSLSMRIPVALTEPRSKVTREIIKIASFILGEEYKEESLFEKLKKLFFGGGKEEFKDLEAIKRIAEEAKK